MGWPDGPVWFGFDYRAIYLCIYFSLKIFIDFSLHWVFFFFFFLHWVFTVVHRLLIVMASLVADCRLERGLQ